MSEKYKNPFLESSEEKIAKKFEQEFNSYCEYCLEDRRRTLEELVEMGIETKEQAQQQIIDKKSELNELDFNGRVIALTNNFFLWWPGGWYREKLKNKKQEDYNYDEVTADERLIADLDEEINKAGYGNMLELIQKKNTNKEEDDIKWQAVAAIFLAMLDRGYTLKQLRK